jgi:hypothetical protein
MEKKMNNLGIDLGRTIKGSTSYDGVFENAFEVIQKLHSKFDNIYIISRVNSEQRERALLWFIDTNFFQQTGIDSLNVYFCWDRRDKALFVKALNINVFIDDRPTVLMHMDDGVKKILFNPSEIDTLGYSDAIVDKNMTIAKNWLEVEKLLL